MVYSLHTLSSPEIKLELPIKGIYIISSQRETDSVDIYKEKRFYEVSFFGRNVSEHYGVTIATQTSLDRLAELTQVTRDQLGNVSQG